MTAENKPRPLDLAALRARLQAQTGPTMWRSLEELADTDEFRALVRRALPRQAAALDGRLSRRDFLKLLAAGLGLAGLTACSPPRERVVPYVERPEAVLPGLPLFFATAMPLSGYGLGLLVESHEGRPTKVEGNPLHPASLGATDAYAQAAPLTLYDPERSQAVTFQGRIRPWEDFVRALAAQAGALRGSGAGLRILTETVGSPTLADQLTRLLETFPEARWHQYEPVNQDAAYAGAALAFGEPVETRYQLDQAEVIVSLDADFLARGPGHARYLRDFAARRRVAEGAEAGMVRLYVAETALTPTGAAADHRLPAAPSQVEQIARALAAAVGVAGLGAAALAAGAASEWAAAAARDLLASGARGVVIAGGQQPPAVHALAHAINATLGSAGTTVVYTDPVLFNPNDQLADVRALAADLAAGQVSALLILGGNPAYTAPADLDLARLMAEAPFSAHLSLYANETSAACQWHVPQTHFLEAWGDVRAVDGTVSIIQPLIAPLYGGRSEHEVLALLSGQGTASAYNVVRAYWQGVYGGDDFERFWLGIVHDGVVPGTALPPRSLSVSLNAAALDPGPPAAEGLEAVFRPDYSVYDGRFANNAWLQELPRPVTQLTWDNAALIGPATAERLGVQTEDVVALTLNGRTVEAPVWVMPGHAPEAVTLPLGYGRTAGGSVGAGVGFNAYSLRTAGQPWLAPGLTLAPTGRRYPLAATQLHHLMEGRPIVLNGTLAQFQADPDFLHAGASGHGPGDELETLSLYPEYRYDGNRWGMAIDLSTCVGCQACVVACQAENNIPVVGKDEVRKQREMHWLRVDSYYAGDPENPQTFFQPVPCMHCEKAPCEVVCPTNATVHSDDGLNDMVYNRCVGTRYCSNNCPYKVRRFNFLQYSDYDEPAFDLLNNPDVTVRTRGVMEKCTYCVQRIRRAQQTAGQAGRPVRDGEVVTACAAACPAEAIVFGDLNDPASRVARLKASPLNYGLLEELNTQPRTTYLAAIRNPGE